MRLTDLTEAPETAAESLTTLSKPEDSNCSLSRESESYQRDRFGDNGVGPGPGGPSSSIRALLVQMLRITTSHKSTST